jgi:hypothetical protein
MLRIRSYLTRPQLSWGVGQQTEHDECEVSRRFVGRADSTPEAELASLHGRSPSR